MTEDHRCECAHAERDHGKICLVAACPCTRYAMKPESPVEKPEPPKGVAAGLDMYGFYGGIV